MGHLDAYYPHWKLSELTRKEFLEYLAHLAGLGLVDSTVSKHVKFLRECFRLAGKVLPAWLKVKTRYGRAPALQQQELRALMALELTDELREEAALFTFQTLLLLRDSDLRALRPHHVRPVDLPGYPATPVLTFHQAKTGDEVRVPLPPAAAAIWQGWEGRPPVPTQQERNRRMKQLARVAQLTRPFVRVQYVRGDATEQVLPLYKVITTHTARHTGADMVMLGSGGDSNLKEKALGHAGVYGHDALERYGPATGLGAGTGCCGCNEKKCTRFGWYRAPGCTEQWRGRGRDSAGFLPLSRIASQKADTKWAHRNGLYTL